MENNLQPHSGFAQVGWRWDCHGTKWWGAGLGNSGWEMDWKEQHSGSASIACDWFSAPRRVLMTAAGPSSPESWDHSYTPLSSRWNYLLIKGNSLLETVHCCQKQGHGLWNQTTWVQVLAASHKLCDFGEVTIHLTSVPWLPCLSNEGNDGSDLIGL